MKILITADWHLGIQLGDYDRRPDLLDSIRQIKDIVTDVKPDVVIHAGDVFHTNRNLTETISPFTEFCLFLSEKEIDTYVIVGNHDIVEQQGKTHAIDIPYIPRVSIMSDITRCKIGDNDFLFVPHISRSKSSVAPEQQLEELADEVDKGDTKYYVVSHCNINHIELPNQILLKYNHHVLPSKLIDSKNAIKVFNGHFHRPQDNVGGNKNLYIIGTPQRFQIDEALDDKRVLLLDTDTGEITSISLNCRVFVQISLDLIDNKDNDMKVIKHLMAGTTEIHKDAVIKIKLRIHEKELSIIDVAEMEKQILEHHAYVYKPHVTIVREKRVRIRELSSEDTPEQAVAKFCKEYDKEYLVKKALEYIK